MTSPSWRLHGPVGSETGDARAQANIDNLLGRGKDQDANPAKTDDLTKQEEGTGFGWWPRSGCALDASSTGRLRSGGCGERRSRQEAPPVIGERRRVVEEAGRRRGIQKNA